MNKKHTNIFILLYLVLSLTVMISISYFLNDNLYLDNVGIGKSETKAFFSYQLKEYMTTNNFDKPVMFRLFDCAYKNSTSAVIFSDTKGGFDELELDLEYSNVTNTSLACNIEVYLKGNYYNTYIIN